MTAPSRHISSLRFGGVAGVLDHAREDATNRMRDRLTERRDSGYNELSESEIESLARIAGVVARVACADAVSEAWQLARNADAAPEDFDAPTRRISIVTPGTEPLWERLR